MKDFARKSDQEILQAIFDWQTARGYWPNTKDFKLDEALPSDGICYHRFGGCEAVVRATKLVFNLLSGDELTAVERYQPIIFKRLSAAAQNLAPRRVTHYSLRTTSQSGRPTTSELARYCGGLDAALRTLGLQLVHPTREDLIEALQAATIVLERVPTQNDCGSDALPYQRRLFVQIFGSWAKALQAAGMTAQASGRPKDATLSRPA